ncbi:MAG: hypothetical protein EGQ63_01335, partial [Clostridiales bacterium]|nr:hypothetical protein [Clostridiales bacterium]
MKKKFQQFICKYGVQLCAVAMALSPLISKNCQRKYYQPKEPDGLQVHMNSNKGLCICALLLTLLSVP